MAVREPSGHLLGHFNLGNQVTNPGPQFTSDFWSTPEFLIQVKALDPEQLDETKEELRGVLRRIRHVPPGVEDDFAINQQETFINTFHRVAGTIAAAGLFITGLPLFVGGL